MAGYIGSKASVVSSGAERKKTFTITGATTSLTGLNYTVGKVHVFQNGVRLVDGTDYTATNGTTITLTVAAQSGDNVVVISQADFQVSGAVSTSGDSMTGDLLVGKTSDDAGASIGVINRANGRVYATVSGGEPAKLNRLSSDGDIIDFKKDGTTVGSIGTISGNLGIVSGNVGLRFRNTEADIIPVEGDFTSRDAAIDLGDPSYRFKDAYLSGGVYLGGTGSANKLEDYEEGTWNPTFSDEASGGNTATGSIRGLYTKIGDQVTVACTAIGLSTSGMTSTNDLRIQGLPFTASSYNSPNNYWQGATRFKNVNFNTNGWVSAFVLDATTYVRLGETVVGTGNDNITVSQILSSADVYFTLTYQTNS
jgi:hypothetical protein